MRGGHDTRRKGELREWTRQRAIEAHVRAAACLMDPLHEKEVEALFWSVLATHRVAQLDEHFRALDGVEKILRERQEARA